MPLAAQNALSQKDLDDATGNEKEAEAAVIAAQGRGADRASSTSSYTTIKSPLKGLSSFARQQDGSYVTADRDGPAHLRLPARSDVGELQHLGERDLLSYRDQISEGPLQVPAEQRLRGRR